MKKLKKRFVAMIMALTMAVSFSTVAFAAETEDTSIMSDQSSEEQVIVEPMSDTVNIVNLTGIRAGASRSIETYGILVPENRRYLYFGYASEGSAIVTIYDQGGNQLSKVVTSKSRKDKVTWYKIPVQGSLSNNYWTPGLYTAEVKIPFDNAYSYGIYVSTSPL